MKHATWTNLSDSCMEMFLYFGWFLMSAWASHSTGRSARTPLAPQRTSPLWTTQNITHHISHITYHISHITSHITHHTSHITHHTSHITHHTSHITEHINTNIHNIRNIRKRKKWDSYSSFSYFTFQFFSHNPQSKFKRWLSHTVLMMSWAALASCANDSVTVGITSRSRYSRLSGGRRDRFIQQSKKVIFGEIFEKKNLKKNLKNVFLKKTSC